MNKAVLTKFRNEKEYVYHIIGTMNTLRYDVERCELQLIIQNVVVQWLPVIMTYEEFGMECENLFLRAIQRLFGFN